MKEIIVDMRQVDPEGEESFADLPEKALIESALLDYAGKSIVRVRITVYRGIK